MCSEEKEAPLLLSVPPAAVSLFVLVILASFESVSVYSFSVRSTVAVSLASCLQYRASREVSGCCRKLPIHIRCRRLGFSRDMALSRSLQATPTSPSVSRESRTRMANRLSHPHLSSPSSRKHCYLPSPLSSSTWSGSSQSLPPSLAELVLSVEANDKGVLSSSLSSARHEMQW